MPPPIGATARLPGEHRRVRCFAHARSSDAAKSRATFVARQFLSSTFNCVWQTPPGPDTSRRARGDQLWWVYWSWTIAPGPVPTCPTNWQPHASRTDLAGCSPRSAPRTYYATPALCARCWVGRRNRARGAPASSWLRATGPRCMSTRQLTASMLRQKPPARSWLVAVEVVL